MKPVSSQTPENIGLSLGDQASPTETERFLVWSYCSSRRTAEFSQWRSWELMKLEKDPVQFLIAQGYMKRVLERTHQKNSQRHQILQGIQLIHKLVSIYCSFSLHTKQYESLWLVSDPSSHKSSTQLLHACGRAPPVCLSAMYFRVTDGYQPSF